MKDHRVMRRMREFSLSVGLLMTRMKEVSLSFGFCLLAVKIGRTPLGVGRKGILAPPGVNNPSVKDSAKENNEEI